MEEPTLTSPLTLFEKLPKGTQQIARKVLGFGVGAYVSHMVLTSPEFRSLCLNLADLTPWGGGNSRKIIRGQDYSPDSEDFCPLLFLPWKARSKIWKHMNLKDLESLRGVSKGFQWEIDQLFGSAVDVDYRLEEEFAEISEMFIRSSKIHRLRNMKDWGFVREPRLLRSLSLTSKCVINPLVLDVIMEKFQNLEQLAFHFFNDGYKNDTKSVAAFRIIHAHRQNKGFVSLRIQYWPCYETNYWMINFDNFSGYSEAMSGTVDDPYPCKLKSLALNFEHFSGYEGQSTQNRIFWREFMAKQTRLEHITCNFGPVCWDIFAQIIWQNRGTLRSIFLENVCCWDYWDAATDQEAPFDWNFFAACPNLVNLHLRAENSWEPGLTFLYYAPLQPSVTNLKKLSCDFGVMPWNFFSSLIQYNAHTLEHVNLSSVVSMDRTSGQASPLDWKIFEDCSKLQSLAVCGGGRCGTFVPTINFMCLPMQNLTRFFLKQMTLTEEEIHFMFDNTPKVETDIGFIAFNSMDGKSFIGGCGLEELIGSYKNKMDPPKSFLYRAATELPLFDLMGTVWLLCQ